MTLQTSGPISLANIQTEFGGSSPISLSEYYGRAAGIPGSGAISIGAFYGKSAAPVPIAVYLTPEASNRYADNRFSSATINDPISVNPVGGTGPYTTTAVRLTGFGPISIAVNSPTQVTISSSAPAGVGIIRNASFRVTVTDALGNTGSEDIFAAHEYSGS